MLELPAENFRLKYGRDPVLVHKPELGNLCCVESKLLQPNILIVMKTVKAIIRGQ